MRPSVNLHPLHLQRYAICQFRNRWAGGGVGGVEEAALERVRTARARFQAARGTGDAFWEAQAAEALEDACAWPARTAWPRARATGGSSDRAGSPEAVVMARGPGRPSVPVRKHPWRTVVVRFIPPEGAP